MAAAVATNVSEGQSTSSPGPMPRARKARNSAAVPLETATASAVPVISAKSFSNASVRGPAVIHSELSVSRTALSSRSSNSSSDSRAFHMCFQEKCFHIWEFFVCFLVVIGAADVEPVSVALVSHHALLIGQEPLHEFREIEFLSARNVLAHVRRK